MTAVSKRQIEIARAVNLYDFMTEQMPCDIFRSSAHEIRLVAHDSLNITPSGKWHWHSRGFGGADSVDFFMRVYHDDYPSAVLRLCSFRPSGAPHAVIGAAPGRRETTKPFRLPRCKREPTQAVRYLHEQRGIDLEILNDCVEQSRLRECAAFGNCLFIGYDLNGRPRFCTKRATEGTYHGDLGGSDKRYGFYLPADEATAADTVVVCEAPIDALSAATLEQMKHGAALRRSRYYLALSGTSPLALLQFLKDHPRVCHVVLCLDADKTGRRAARRLEELREDETFRAQVKSLKNQPPLIPGTDANDRLLSHLKFEVAKKRVLSLFAEGTDRP